MSNAAPPNDVTRALRDWTSGDEKARNRLMGMVYDELRRIAHRQFQRERANHTLQATALVHEAYVRLSDHQEIDWQNRAHFLSVAAQVMRRILVDHARAHRAEKRGGNDETLSLDGDVGPAIGAVDVNLIALDDALADLAAFDQRQSRIVEMRFFGGLTNEEIAEVLRVSSRTVKREWRVARAWLKRELRDGEERAA